MKGIATGLQIENYLVERNPYYHTPRDSIAQINQGYWLEQVKATIATVAGLAVPVPNEKAYLPLLVKVDLDPLEGVSR